MSVIPMSAIDVAYQYFDAWNRHDAAGVVATLAPDGTYTDPTTRGPLSGEALISYINGIVSAFPDLSFEIISAAPAGDGLVAGQWLMKGTNTGPFAGAPPTGQSVALPGADFIIIEDDKICSVQSYFDQRTFVEQLGLQAIVQPYSIGPFTFGTSTRATTGKRTKPGAFSLTWLEVRSEEEVNEVRERGRQVVQEMMQMPGFISSANMVVGRRLITTTAWENTEAPKQLLRGGAHKEAMGRFFNSDFAAVGTTMVFVPDHINAMWMRCTVCGQVANYDQSQGKCRCGQPLPEHPPYW
jgi:steroid delta-isomerase-like uncharacterized protein